MPGTDEPKSATDLARELWELARAYAQQEAVDPLKNLGRYLGFGIAGSLLLAIGSGFLTLGLLRLLQTVEVFEDSWSWVPYGITVAAILVVVAAMGASIKRSFERPAGAGGPSAAADTTVGGR